MTTQKEQLERAEGDKLIYWLNEEHGTNFSFSRRAGEAPDLVYSQGSEELFVEVTVAYYDRGYAKLLWDITNAPKAPVGPWVGEEPDASLAGEIKNRIKVKSKKTYGKNCILLVVVPPALTFAEELEDLLKDKQHDLAETPFAGVYVAGRFPTPLPSPGEYRVLPIKSFRKQSAAPDRKR